MTVGQRNKGDENGIWAKRERRKRYEPSCNK
jgi:hypothetical protein